jgi:hypothetical protein
MRWAEQQKQTPEADQRPAHLLMCTEHSTISEAQPGLHYDNHGMIKDAISHELQAS